LDEALEIVNVLARKAVDAFKRGPERLFVAERLYRFGSVVMTPLEKLLETSEDSELRILASMVLLQLGSTVGVPWLLNAIVNDDEYACMAAMRLAEAGIVDAGDGIVARLRSCELEMDGVVGLLFALEKLGHEIPLDLRKRFAAPDVPWHIRTMMSPDASHEEKLKYQGPA
jgi:hypothetical protein